MTTFGDLVLQLGGVPVGTPLAVMLAGGNWLFVDPTNGSTNGDGKTPGTAIKDLQTAHDRLRSGYNDGVILIGGATQMAPTAKITWSNSYCHLIGATNGLPGMGERARIVNTSANNLATLFELSGSGCLFANMQFFDGKNTAQDGQCLLVSGDRNMFINVFVAGMGDSTASGPFSRAGSYSCKITGQENCFKDCTIGLDTITRTAANSELIVSGPRNHFIHCELLCQSVTAGKFLVTIDASGGDLRDTIFEDCMFRCYTPNWATGITDAIHIIAGNTYSVILDTECQLAGVGMGWADTVTHVYGVGSTPNAGFGISLAPTT
jgi:hypothetical protein